MNTSTDFTINGKYGQAKVFTDQVDDATIGQIYELCNQEFTRDSKIRMMPDLHYGKGCVIGTTMTIQDKIVPNLVGVDIGCGMNVSIINVDPSTISFDKLDTLIRKHIPHGQNAHDANQRHAMSGRLNSSKFAQVAPINLHAPVDISRAYDNVGTLGGGNHFIEINLIDEETIALVIHSGSRNVGAQVARYHQNKAYDELSNNHTERQRIIQELTKQGRTREIEQALKTLGPKRVNKELAYLENDSYHKYMHDMKIAQNYALLNRKAMAYTILSKMKWKPVDSFDTIHNYIDFDNKILRKGAISAQKDERVIIPINMRDGSIIAYGKGNPDWNFSGPHGAGRVLSRSRAKQEVNYAEFEESMRDVWTTSVSESTLDESPMAYKSLENIINYVDDTLEIKQIMKPLYNFKSS